MLNPMPDTPDQRSSVPPRAVKPVLSRVEERGRKTAQLVRSIDLGLELVFLADGAQLPLDVWMHGGRA